MSIISSNHLIQQRKAMAELDAKPQTLHQNHHTLYALLNVSQERSMDFEVDRYTPFHASLQLKDHQNTRQTEDTLYGKLQTSPHLNGIEVLDTVTLISPNQTIALVYQKFLPARYHHVDVQQDWIST